MTTTYLQMIKLLQDDYKVIVENGVHKWYEVIYYDWSDDDFPEIVSESIFERNLTSGEIEIYEAAKRA